MATDLLSVGDTFLAEKRHAFMARPIIYRTSGGELAIDATPGRVETEVVDQQTGAVSPSHARDYIVRAVDLRINGVPIDPKPGHLIVDGQFVFEVCDLGIEPCFRLADNSGIDLRIHTKQAAGSLAAQAVGA